MNTGINESKTLAKHISCECKCTFHGRKCNSDQWWNNSKYRCECKKRHVCETDYIWNPSTCSCENGKYFASIMVNSAIMCNEFIQQRKKRLFQQILRKRTQSVKRKISIFYLHFC